jgi:hypothetical protein
MVLLFPGPQDVFPQKQDREEKPPRLEDFAGSLALSGREDSLLRIEVPEELYQGIERPDMADVRIFDAQGFTVPFTIRPAPPLTVEIPPAELPFFPWAEEQGNPFPGTTDIVIDTEGAVLNIKSRGKGPSAAEAYLLDLSGLAAEPEALNISLGKEGELYNTTATLYSSVDLVRWVEFEKKQTLAYFGGGIGREVLELPPGENRCLLLKFGRPGLLPRRISAVFGKREIPPAPREKTIAGSWTGEDRRIARYSTGGFYPLISIGFPLPRSDSFEALVKYRFGGEEEWRTAARTTLFRVNDGTGGILENRALEIGYSAPYWELESPGAMAVLPDCRIRWAVYDLVFLGRGPGPWTLAWGNGDYGPPGGLSLPPDLRMDDPAIENAQALGNPVYRPRAPAGTPATVDWGRFILWGILILAAMVLSGLAFYIAKSMEKERS